MQEDLQKAKEIVLQGGTILYPTDTIWGIGCDATNAEAVQKIYRIKKRKDAKSMLVLLGSEKQLVQYIQEIPEIARQLIEITAKPLTLIYPGAKNLAANLIAEDGSIGIRIVHDTFCQQLIHAVGRPLVSTSANFSGETSPAGFGDIHENIRMQTDYVVRWRQDEISNTTPSGIIKLGLRGEVQVIRE